MKIESVIPRAVKSAVKRALQIRSMQVSQAGQDFWVIGEVFNEMRGGFFVDIGAHDGVELSNSYLLEKRYGWHGICIEANPESFAQLRKNRSSICVNACLDCEKRTVNFSKDGMRGGIVGSMDDEIGDVISVQTETLQDVLASHQTPRVIDYLSVDVEGAEDRVFSGFDVTSYNITCLTVERPSDDLRGKLGDAGFVLIKDIPGLDAFFLHESHADAYLQNVFAFYNKRHFALRWK